MEQEIVYLIEVPGGDRRYVARSLDAGRYGQLKRDYPGCRIFKIVVNIPVQQAFDEELQASSVSEWDGEFGSIL